MIWHTSTRQISPDAKAPKHPRFQPRVRRVAGCRSKSSRGFSLIEVITVVLIILILTAIAAVALAPMKDSAKLNTAVQTTINQLRMAREEAMGKRLQYVVTLQQPGTILTQWTKAGIGIQTERSVPLPAGIEFVIVTGIPTTPKTPDGFGAGNVAIDLDQAKGGGSNVIYFQPDGTATDAAGNPNNGVLYIAKPGQLSSSRAITLFGSTGRLRTWYLTKRGATVKWQ